MANREIQFDLKKSIDRITLGCLLAEIEEWSEKYDFNFQFWGSDKFTVYIEKDGIEMTDFGGRETVEELLTDTLQWIYDKNKVPPQLRLFV